MTRFPDLFTALCAPFDREEVKERPGGRGRILHYVTARTVANRLDEVLGPEAWSERYYEAANVLFCELTITLPDGTKFVKADAGGFKQMMDNGQVDQENTDKTGSTDAFKRAAAKAGVGRYLYQDGIPDFGGEPASHRAETNGHAAPATPRQTESRPAAPHNGDLPRSGKGVWREMKQAGERIGADITRPFSQWKDAEGLPRELDQWSPEHIAMGMAKVAELVARYTDESQEPAEDRTPPRPPAAPPMPRPLGQQGSPGPMGWEPGDPLAELKQSVKALAFRCSKLSMPGHTPTEEETRNRMNLEADAACGQPIGSLRECRDRPLLTMVRDHMTKTLDDIRAMGGAA